MASFNLTVEDSSPLITYSPAGSWIDTPAGDALAVSYSGGSFHTTTTQGAIATINFNGTGISVFGGHRPNYGTFSLAVDGQLITAGTSQSAVPSTRQLLGTVSGLINGPHTAVFVNANGQPIDIDSIEFESQVGGPGSVLTSNTIDDNDTAITYLPSPSAWQTTLDPAFFNGTLHSSQTPGASASLLFTGEAVALYGTVSPNHANIQIAIDGQSLILPGGSDDKVSAVRPQILLYYQNNLVPGQHTLVLSGDSTAPDGSSIDLDSITAFTSMSANGTGAENSLPKSSASLSTGTPIGAIVGGVLAFLLLVTLLVLGLLYRRRRKARFIEDKVPVSPKLPMQRDPKTLEAGLSRDSVKVEDRSIEDKVPVSPEFPMQTDPKVLEAGLSRNSVKVEGMVFPFPLPTATAVGQRPATPGSTTSPSRNSSITSSTSTTRLITSAPVLSVPRRAATPGSTTSHSRNSSITSSTSTTALVTSAPVLSARQPRSARRKPVPMASADRGSTLKKKDVRFEPVVEHIDANPTPSRPNTRPPTIDFTDFDPE